MALQHLRSGTANKRPLPTAMSDGQLAVNTNLASPGLFFKDGNGDLVKVGPVHIGSTAPNASPASTAATALVANTVYQILTVGTSDFTAVGASANTVGVVFTATGTTTGTGTVSGQQGNEKGEMWLDNTGGSYVFKIYDGTAWRSEVGEFVNATGDTMTGDLLFNNANIVFEGSAADDHETTLTVVNPTADRTITLPNVTGTVVTTGDTGTVATTIIADDAVTAAKLANTAVTAGSYTLSSITVDAQGRLTAASSGIAADTDKIAEGNTEAEVVDTGSDGHFKVTTEGTERLRIDSSGRVGVGITSLTDRFEIQDTTQETTQLTVRSRTNTGIASIGIVGAPNGGGSRALYLKYLHATDKFSLETTTGNGICLFKNSGGEHLNIDSSGRLLVGTTTEGNADADDLTLQASSGYTGITLRSGTTAGGAIYFSDATSGSGEYDGYITYSQNSQAFSFGTAGNGSPRMLIDSSGNVFIGGSTASSADIALNANGSITAAGSVKSTNGSGTAFLGATSGTGLAINNSSNATVVELNYDGSGTFANNVTVDNNLRVNNNLAVHAAGGNLYEGYSTSSGSSVNTFAVNANGTITSANTASFGAGVNTGSTTAYGVKCEVATNAANVIAQTQQTASAFTYMYRGYQGTSLTYYVLANGTAVFSGSVTASNVSDVRFKENITDAKPQLEDTVALGSQLKNFDWNDDAPLNEELRAKRFLGLVAQEAEKVCPGLTYTVPRTKQGKELTPAVLDEEGNETKAATYEELDDSYKAINHDILVMKLLGAVAELSAKVAALEAG